jgi:nucleotide-binding universal stress UspA family protein
MYEKILVPLDGSQLAETALESALHIARKQSGEIILLTVPTYGQVMAPGPAGYSLMTPSQSPEILSEDAETYLDGIYRRINSPGIEVVTEVVGGDIAGNIVDMAAAEKADLIVMTTHGYSGFTRWMMGSITERVLRSAPCPVLVIRCGGLPKNAVITLDGSALAEKALIPGLNLARLMGAEVTLLMIDQSRKLGDLELNLLEAAGGGLGQQIAQEEQDNGSQYLQSIVDKHQTANQEIESIVLGGSPADSILAYVEKKPVELLVMATHGHSGLKRWVYGSVTEKCLHNSACAMLIVRPDIQSLN